MKLHEKAASHFILGAVQNKYKYKLNSIHIQKHSYHLQSCSLLFLSLISFPLKFGRRSEFFFISA